MKHIILILALLLSSSLQGCGVDVQDVGIQENAFIATREGRLRQAVVKHN